jgi:hypothetical protein
MMALEGMNCDGVKWIQMAYDRVQQPTHTNKEMYKKGEEFLDHLNVRFSSVTALHGFSKALYYSYTFVISRDIDGSSHMNKQSFIILDIFVYAEILKQ